MAGVVWMLSKDGELRFLPVNSETGGFRGARMLQDVSAEVAQPRREAPSETPTTGISRVASASVAMGMLGLGLRSRNARWTRSSNTHTARADHPGEVSASPSSSVAAVAGPLQPGLLLLEHLNLNVTSTDTARAFYAALGCPKDMNKKGGALHSNCGGLTQFHLPTSSEGSQTWRGQIELLYLGRKEVLAAHERLQMLLKEADFEGTKLTVGEPIGDGDSIEAEVVGPYGNRFVLRVASAERGEALGSKSGKRPGSDASTCLGIGSVTLEVPVGTAEGGARFYSEVLGFSTREVSPGKWAVLGGPEECQCLLLEEKEGVTGREVGEHVAIYIGDFCGAFDRLLERGLIWVNPRFVHLDNSNTLEEALHYKCFRFRDIVDPRTGEKLFELEHETRSISHKRCALDPERLLIS